MAVTRIIGIDPGSRITGYGIIDTDGRQQVYVDSGCIRTGGGSMPDRLKIIFDSVRELMIQYKPDEMAVEQVFLSRNPDSALKLGHARGAAICAGVTTSITVAEYAARAIKQAVVGTGAADKDQVQHMVTALLKLSSTPQADAADALAVALCHSHSREMASRIPASVKGVSGGRWR